MKTINSHHEVSHRFFSDRYSHRLFLLSIALLTASILSGCGGIQVYPDNPILVKNDDTKTAAATVYFIRPKMLKPKGYADDSVTVDFEDHHLLSIEQGYYTMVKIKPAKGNVVTRSMTSFTNRIEPIKVQRMRSYNFLAGKTYFILLKQINDGFRGVFYDPKQITLAQAKKIIYEDDEAAARGAARDAPIKDIKQVPETPPEGDLLPALPENLYPHYEYMKKKPIRER